MGMTSCNGTGLTNSVGIHIDRTGNDTYAGRRGSLNTGRPARGFSSIGVLVDLGGQDHYLGIMEDGGIWRQADVGVGVDETPEAADGPGPTAEPAPDEPPATIPAICSYEGELTQAVFDELWAIAIRWEVGENRRIVPVARKRLVAFGAALLPYLDRAMDQDASGLELRAYADVLGGLAEGGAAAGVTDLLRRNIRWEGARRPRVALWLAGEMKAVETEPDVVALLEGEDRSLARRAAAVLARIGSHAGDETLLKWLRAPDDELAVQAALGTLLGLDTPCYAAARPLLDHPLVSVRSRLAALLGAHDAAYAADVVADLGADDLGPRARRTLLDALVRMPPARAAAAAGTLVTLLDDEDWGMRADAARALRRALNPEGADAAQRTTIENALKQRLATETHPYVRSWLEAPR
jgi:hypothetical protein